MSVSDLSAQLPGGAHVLFTKRVDGNMSSVGGEGSEQGAAARERLRARTGVDFLARVYQMHGTDIQVAHDGSTQDLGQEELPRADAQITTTRGLGLIVLAADCLPVALGREGAVAMIHAGWRGLAAGVLESTVREVSAWGGGTNPNPSKILAVIGPAAGACCYEVGSEVHEAFGDLDRGTSHIDLRAIARERLLAAGVDQVEDLGGCTICDERYFSHRREGQRSGRMAGVAWLS
jgi:YfiH family protein